MEKTRKWRKILAMMLTVVMMLQNAQSVMVFADVTNEQIEQRLAGNQGQTEETQPAQSQVDTRANGEEYKTQSQETQENGNGSTDIGSPESGNATTEAKTSNADVSATITQSVFQADVSGTTCNFVQMTAQITNNDTENPATGVSVKTIQKFLYQGRIEIPDGSGSYIKCQMCGAEIRYGRFCPECSAKLSRDNSSMVYVGEKPKHKMDYNGKMHTLDESEMKNVSRKPVAMRRKDKK